MSYLLIKYDYKNQSCSTYNHQLLQVEKVITSLLIIMNKHLTGLGQMWPRYLPLATLAYSTFST